LEGENRGAVPEIQYFVLKSRFLDFGKIQILINFTSRRYFINLKAIFILIIFKMKLFFDEVPSLFFTRNPIGKT